MKHTISLISIVSFLILSACGNNETNDTTTDVTKDSIDVTTDVSSEIIEEEIFTQEVTDASVVMLGTWTGEMSGKELTIVIEKIDGNEIFGYNTLGKNRRDLKGTFTDGDWDQPCTKAFEAILNEPGDDEWDGVFTIKFVGYEDESESEDGDLECGGNLKGSEAMGEWKPNNGKASKDFTLVKDL